MRYSMRKNILMFVVPTLVMVLCFCLFYQPHVSANTGNLGEVSKVESVLIKKGDTLSAIAEKYAPEMSHVSPEEYQKQIVALNNLNSEYIQAGHYILLPNYRD
jgi:cell division protein YceG involved in septum cleavage